MSGRTSCGCSPAISATVRACWAGTRFQHTTVEWSRLMTRAIADAPPAFLTISAISIAQCGHDPHGRVNAYLGSSRPFNSDSGHTRIMSEQTITPSRTRSGKSSVGDRIRSLREQAGLTQAELGAEVGTSRAHVAKIETAGDLPGRELLLAMATYFEVSLDWLAEERGEPRPARAMTESETLLLQAFRKLPPDEAEAHLNLLLMRLKHVAA